MLRYVHYLGIYTIIPIQITRSGPYRWRWRVYRHRGTPYPIGPLLFEASRLQIALAFTKRLIRQDKKQI